MSIISQGANWVNQNVLQPVDGAADAAVGSAKASADQVLTVADGVKNGAVFADRFIWSWKTGQGLVMKGDTDPYPQLPADSLAAARARGVGVTVGQPRISDSKDMQNPHEPVNLVVHGTKAELIAALQSQGWIRAQGHNAKNLIQTGLSVITREVSAPHAPVSDMFLDGRLPDLAFSKNSDYTLSRDHMRIWRTGTDSQGRPVWAIASSRDTEVHIKAEGQFPPISIRGADVDFHVPKVDLGHGTDKTGIDGERDLVMKDLLDSGKVATWMSAKGVRQGQEQTLPDGRFGFDGYATDGQVYVVDLGK